MFCTVRNEDNFKLIKSLPYIDKFTAKKTSEFFQVFEVKLKMESKNLYSISVEIPNYSGPLEVLLDLAKTQKVDLAEISITKLADQFLIFIKNQNINLETATEFLLMASWIAYLKSKLLLPDD